MLISCKQKQGHDDFRHGPRPSLFSFRPSSSPTFELPGTSMPCGGVKLRDGFFHMADGQRLFELMQVNTSLFSIFFVYA